jgi:ribose 5-phosphate isomerase A
MNKLSQDQIKARLGEKAVSYIAPHMKVGLGSGTTSHCFIQALAKRCKQEKMHLHCVASSKASYDLAKSLDLDLADVDEIGTLDITIDGADEVDTKGRLIKGAGGAHVREKIIAAMSKELLILVDETKLSDQLGKVKLPLEVFPFAHKVTQKHLENLGYTGSFRKQKSSYYVTDNGNYLLDIEFKKTLDHPEQCESEIRKIPGVIDTGFFFHLASRILVGFFDGQIVEKSDFD